MRKKKERRKKKKRPGGPGHVTCACLLRERIGYSWRSELGQPNEGERRKKKRGKRKLG